MNFIVHDRLYYEGDMRKDGDDYVSPILGKALSNTWKSVRVYKRMPRLHQKKTVIDYYYFDGISWRIRIQEKETLKSLMSKPIFFSAVLHGLSLIPLEFGLRLTNQGSVLSLLHQYVAAIYPLNKEQKSAFETSVRGYLEDGIPWDTIDTLHTEPENVHEFSEFAFSGDLSRESFQQYLDSLQSSEHDELKSYSIPSSQITTETLDL